jgi:drug/metabolite transporter (DMT)-like permease
MTDAKTERYWRGVGIALLAAFSWGFMSPIVKLIAAAGVSLMSAMVVRGLFTAAVMGVWLCCTRGRSVFCQPRRVMRYYLLSGFLTVVCAGCGYLMSLEYLTVAEAMIIHYSFPLVTMLGALWVTREKPTKLQVLAGFLIIVGVFAGLGGGGNFAGHFAAGRALGAARGGGHLRSDAGGAPRRSRRRERPGFAALLQPSLRRHASYFAQEAFSLAGATFALLTPLSRAAARACRRSAAAWSATDSSMCRSSTFRLRSPACSARWKWSSP